MKLENKAISFLQTINKNMDNLYLGFSGGKDSVVIYHLAKKAGIDFTPIYSNTTIDPPGTRSFIRHNFSDVTIIHPKESFYDLVKRKGLPERQTRFCCEHLKERIGIGRNNITGIRASESRARKGRDYIQCDTRKWMKGAQHIYPIYDWHDEDVWEFIYKYDLPIAPCYSDGCERLGCVGCPLATPQIRKFEFSIYPRYYKAIKEAIKIGMLNNPQWKISVATDGNAEQAMQWWLSGKPISHYFDFQYTFEKKDGVWIKKKRKTFF